MHTGEAVARCFSALTGTTATATTTATTTAGRRARGSVVPTGDSRRANTVPGMGGLVALRCILADNLVRRNSTNIVTPENGAIIVKNC